MRLLAGLVLLLPLRLSAQAPIDLFSDVPRLGDGFGRIAGWNLRHIKVEGHEILTTAILDRLSPSRANHPHRWTELPVAGT